jgi:hypothetical protein
MSLPLRITVLSKDYTYKVLTRNINRDTVLILIELEGAEYRLLKGTDGLWRSDVTVSENADLLVEIARSLSLRYRAY